MTVGTLLRARHLGVKEVKNHLSDLLRSHRPIIATQRGEPTYVLVPYEDMVEVIEILEELTDTTLMKRLYEGRQAYQKGGWVPLARLWKTLGVSGSTRGKSLAAHR